MLNLKKKNSFDHNCFEDGIAFVMGTLLNAFSLTILSSLGLITGQLAGCAILLSYTTGWSFGFIYFAINMPMYWFAYKQFGKRFLIKTIICVTLVSILGNLVPYFIEFSMLNPWLGVVLFGVISSNGLLMVIRHGASLGGIGILALYIQDKTGFKMGNVQLIFDFFLFLVAFLYLPFDKVLFSLLGAQIINILLAINHRKDRYIAM